MRGVFDERLLQSLRTMFAIHTHTHTQYTKYTQLHLRGIRKLLDSFILVLTQRFNIIQYFSKKITYIAQLKYYVERTRVDE